MTRDDDQDAALTTSDIVFRKMKNEISQIKEISTVFLQRAADSGHVHKCSGVGVFVLLSACVQAHVKACLSGSQGGGRRAHVQQDD